MRNWKYCIIGTHWQRGTKGTHTFYSQEFESKKEAKQVLDLLLENEPEHVEVTDSHTGYKYKNTNTGEQGYIRVRVTPSRPHETERITHIRIET